MALRQQTRCSSIALGSEGTPQNAFRHPYLPLPQSLVQRQNIVLSSTFCAGGSSVVIGYTVSSTCVYPYLTAKPLLHLVVSARLVTFSVCGRMFMVGPIYLMNDWMRYWLRDVCFADSACHLRKNIFPASSTSS